MALSTGARDRGRELAQRRRDSELARQEYLADLHPACPHEGLPGTYIGIIRIGTIGAAGAETPIRLAFRCPNGDSFAYGSQTGDVWPIAPADEQSVRLEPLDRLNRGGTDQPRAPAGAWSLLGPLPR
jgi:hypothetical protein